MSSAELDLPLLPSAEQIRRREFATIRRGYDPEQVRDYLRQVAAQVETLERQVREARLEAESVRSTAPQHEPEVQPEVQPEVPTTPEVDPYEELAVRLADLIRAADGQAGRIMSEAQTEASRQMNEARAEADRIRTDAQSQAEEARQQGDEVLHHAKIEAERTLSTLSTRREHLVDQLQQMQTRLLGVAQELESALEGDEDDGAVTASAGAPVPSGEDPDIADPNYEALWVSSETATMNIGDIPAMDIDFGDDESDADPH
jgi:DivIVA domain-containing protein